MWCSTVYMYSMAYSMYTVMCNPPYIYNIYLQRLSFRLSSCSVILLFYWLNGACFVNLYRFESVLRGSHDLLAIMGWFRSRSSQLREALLPPTGSIIFIILNQISNAIGRFLFTFHLLKVVAFFFSWFIKSSSQLCISDISYERRYIAGVWNPCGNHNILTSVPFRIPKSCPYSVFVIVVFYSYRLYDTV